MSTRTPPPRTPNGEGANTPQEWSAWEAIDGGLRSGRLETVLQPRNVLLVSMVIIGVLALLYLHMTSDVALANSQLQTEHTQQLQLERQDQRLHLQLGEATSPAHIDRAARAMGLSPAPGTQP